MNPWNPNTYDNRGFDSLDKADDFDDYMLRSIEPGGAWDYLNPEHAYDALADYDYQSGKALKADLGLFMALHAKGEYRQAADIIAGIVTRYCDKGARDDYLKPEIDY